MEKENKMEKLLETFPNEVPANLVAEVLKDAGIDCDIRKDDVGGLYPSFQSTHGVRLFVRQEDYQAAKDILKSLLQGERVEE